MAESHMDENTLYVHRPKQNRENILLNQNAIFNGAIKYFKLRGRYFWFDRTEGGQKIQEIELVRLSGFAMTKYVHKVIIEMQKLE